MTQITAPETKSQVVKAPFLAAIPSGIADIGKQLRTQDEEYTADAIFVVEQKRLIIGIDTAYSTGPEDIVWTIDDSQFFSGSQEFAKLEADYEQSGDIPPNYHRDCFTVQWSFVTAFMTVKDAKHFVSRHGHKYEGGLRVMVNGERRNEQWSLLRNWFKKLEPSPSIENSALLLLTSLYNDTGLRMLMRPDQVRKIETILQVPSN